MNAALNFAEWKWWDLFGLLGALGLAALQKVWHDFRQRRSETWPISYGRIDDIDVDTKEKKTTLTLHYSYPVSSETYTGSFKKDIDDPDEAHRWAEALDGKQVAVRYDPDKNSRSQLREVDLELMVRAAAPVAPTEAAEKHRLAAWERPFVWLGLIFASVGVALTVTLLLEDILGKPSTMGAASKILWQGAVVLFFFSLLEGHRGGKRVARSVPSWMKYLGYGLFYYVVFSAVLFPGHRARQPENPRQPASHRLNYSDARYRMLLYFSAAEILYARLLAEEKETQRGQQGLYGNV